MSFVIIVVSKFFDRSAFFLFFLFVYFYGIYFVTVAFCTVPVVVACGFSPSSDVRLIAHAFLHLPQINPTLSLVESQEVEGNPSFYWGDFLSLLFEGPRRKKPTIEGFPLTNWWWGFFFHWLTNGTPLSRSTAFFVVVVLSVSGQNGDKIVIRCLFLVINFYVHSIALLDYQNICFSLIFAIFDITMKWLCLHPEMNREKNTSFPSDTSRALATYAGAWRPYVKSSTKFSVFCCFSLLFSCVSINPKLSLDCFGSFFVYSFGQI